MIKKLFILTTVIFIAIWMLQWLKYTFTNHNWSRFGFKQHDLTWAAFIACRFFYLVGWGIYLCKLFLEWYFNLEI